MTKRILRRVALVGTVVAIGTLDTRGVVAQPGKGVDALGTIVGVWQSDTTNGVSAMSNCAWTPEHGAVLCEQRITMPDGEHRALSLFAFDPATSHYVFYVLQKPGDPANPVALAIDGTTWTYGGKEPSGDGKYYRTINDFAHSRSYTWRQESSVNGRDWIAGAHGSSKRLR